jgi:RNA polymerase sigma factor
MMLFFLSIITKRKVKPSLEEMAISIQNGDEQLLNNVLEDYKPFVKKTVSSVCKRYITDNDDEFSIGLIAFNDAIWKYNQTRGSSLISFAEIVIKRKVIDYIRKNAKDNTVGMEQASLSDENSATSSVIENSISVSEYEKQQEASNRGEEILAFQKQLEQYKLTFQELVENSPKHEDARLNAISIAQIIVQNRELKSYLLEKKRLPMKKLEKLANVSRKTIERNRKYIIAITIILMGDYYYLRDYLKGRLDI